MTAALPLTLVEGFAQNNGVLIVGSALSAFAGLPTEAELTRLLAAELEDYPSHAKLAEVAQDHENEHGHTRLVQKLREAFDRPAASPTAAHLALVKLPAQAILTTALDDLLEQAAKQAQVHCDIPIVGQNTDVFWRSDRLQLVKLRGELAMPESLVVTQANYLQFADRQPHFGEIVREALRRRTVLCVGCDIESKEMDLLLAALPTPTKKARQHFVLLPAEAKPRQITRWEKSGFKVIQLAAPAPQALADWLALLAKAVSKKRAETQPTPPKAPEATASASLGEEVTLWLRAMGHTVETLATQERTWEVLATPTKGVDRQPILVRCVVGELQAPDAVELAQAVEANRYGKGWLVSDRLVPSSVQRATQANGRVTAFNLADWVAKIFGQYFAWLDERYAESGIAQYYVDLSIWRPVFDTEGHHTGDDEYPVIDTYVDSWLKARDSSHLSLLGDSGAGKTWFCLRYAHQQLQRYRKDPVHERLPILISLRDYVKQVEVASLVRKLFDEQGIELDGKTGFDLINAAGKFLLIFDGFDEMALKVDYHIVVSYFWELAEVVRSERSKALLTCRTGYFRHASEAETVLHGREQAGEFIVARPPKFDIIYLAEFDEPKIEQIITRRRDAPTAKRILENKHVLQLCKQPVLIEILLQALTDIDPRQPLNLSELYHFATQRWLERDVSSVRTFMALGEKQQFMQALAWGMISTSTLKIHYEKLYEHIGQHFGPNPPEQKAHLDYDIRTRSFLRRDAQGYYEFMHKSLAEYFTALKFALELGVATSLFCQNLPVHDLQANNVMALAQSFGKLPLTKMPEVADFLAQMALANPEPLLSWVYQTRGKRFEKVAYVGGNIVSVLKRFKGFSFAGLDFGQTVLVEADFTEQNLTETNFKGADLRRAELRFTQYAGQTLDGKPLRGHVISSPLFEKANINEIDWNITRTYTGGGGGCFLAGTLIKLADGTEKPIEQIQVGEQVLSFCWQTNSLQVGIVSHLFEGETFEYIKINNTLGITPLEQVSTQNDWLRAYALQEGKGLKTDTGSKAVWKVQRFFQKQPVFNLTTDPYHNFFANNILTHNKHSHRSPRAT